MVEGGEEETKKMYSVDELFHSTLPCQTVHLLLEDRGISRKNLPGNIKVSRTRTTGPRKRRTKKKKVRFALANTPTQDRARKIKKKYRKLRRAQTGRGIVGDLAKLGLNTGSKAINSVLGKKLIDKGIENIPNLYRYGTSKIKNKNVQRALNSDVANCVVEETQNKAKNKLTNLFGSVEIKK